jgi:hypothetical protein
MKYALKIILFSLAIQSCSFDQLKYTKENPNLELEVINEILPQLIPKNSPCMVVPIEDEDDKDYAKRLGAFYAEVDSVGKKIEIVSQLSQLDSDFIKWYPRSKGKTFVKHLLNAPKEDRRIDSTQIHRIEGVKIILVKEPRRIIGGLTDCYTLGQFNLSRVGFNHDSTRAAFRYFIDDGSCTGGKGGVIDAERKNGKWQIRRH